MGQLYILDLTKRGVDITKSRRHRDGGPSLHTVATYNMTPMGMDHPKGPDGRFVDGHPSVAALGDMPDFAHRLSDADLKRAKAQNQSLTSAIAAEEKRRAAAVQVAKPLKATPRVKTIDPALAAKVKEIRKRPIPGDIEFLERELPKLTVAQIVELGGPDAIFPSRDKKGKVDDLIRSLTHFLQSEAITHNSHDSGMSDPKRNAEKRALQDEFKRRKELAVQRGDREEYAALVAGFGIAGTGPGLPPEKGGTAPALRLSPQERITVQDLNYVNEGDDARRRRLAREAREATVKSNPAKPLKATAPKGKLETAGMQGADANMDRLARKLEQAKTVEEGRELVAGLKVVELKALAGVLGMKGTQPNKKAWQDEILNFTVQNKLNSQAIRDQTNFAPKTKADDGRTLTKLQDKVARLTVRLDEQSRKRKSGGSRVMSAPEARTRRELDAAKRELKAAQEASGWAPGVHADDAAKAMDDALIASVSPAGPSYLNTPRTVQGNGAFGPGSFHPDGRMGTAWQGLSERQGSENIGGMRLDDALAETMRMGYDGQPGRIGEQMARFREIISQVKDPKVKADLEYAFGRLKPQAPHGLSAKELADAPEPLRRLMSQLETIPDTGQGGGEVGRLADILRRWSSGELRADMLDIEVQRLSGLRHESQEGHHEVARAVDKAAEWIRAMRHDLRRPEPGDSGPKA